MLFQQTACPDCNDDAGMAPGAVAMREALGWINVGFMIGTTLMILWQLGKNVSFRAKKMALMAAGLGPEGGQGGASRMHHPQREMSSWLRRRKRLDSNRSGPLTTWWFRRTTHRTIRIPKTDA